MGRLFGWDGSILEFPNVVRNSELHVRFGPFSAETRLANRAPLLCARGRLAGSTFAARSAHRTPRLCVPRRFSLSGAEDILVGVVAVNILVGVDADAFEVLEDADAGAFDILLDADANAFDILVDADAGAFDILVDADANAFDILVDADAGAFTLEASSQGLSIAEGFVCVRARSVVAGPACVHARSIVAGPACARSRRRRRASAWPRAWPAFTL